MDFANSLSKSYEIDKLRLGSSIWVKWILACDQFDDLPKSYLSEICYLFWGSSIYKLCIAYGFVGMDMRFLILNLLPPFKQV